MIVLLTDASANLRRSLRQALEQAGFTDVHEAAHALQAHALLDAMPVDVILTGAQLHGMSGVEFTARLRRTPRFRHLPVIMVSDRAQSEDVLAAAEAGIDGYVLLPFQVPFLVNKVMKVAERALGRPPADDQALPVPAPAPAPAAFNVHQLYLHKDYAQSA